MIQKSRKISVLGVGNVGATIAYTLMLQGTASEIVLVDVNKAKAEGEAIDLTQCAVCAPSCKVRCGEYEDVAGSDVIIVTFGVGRKPGQTRLDLAKINVGILESVMPTVAKIAPDAIYVIVSNPVDVLTYATIKCTGLPVNQVIGTGTLLDSNRLTQAVASYCKVDAYAVNSYVLGEHGDACMVPWSLCTIGGMPVENYCKDVMGVNAEELEKEFADIYEGMVKSGSKVIAAKGATFYAIAASTCKLVKAIFSNTDTLLPLSTVLNGEYGANDICMGVPCIVNASGFKKIVNLALTDKEKALLQEKVDSLTATFRTLGMEKK